MLVRRASFARCRHLTTSLPYDLPYHLRRCCVYLTAILTDLTNSPLQGAAMKDDADVGMPVDDSQVATKAWTHPSPDPDPDPNPNPNP